MAKSGIYIIKKFLHLFFGFVLVFANQSSVHSGELAGGGSVAVDISDRLKSTGETKSLFLCWQIYIFGINAVVRKH